MKETLISIRTNKLAKKKGFEYGYYTFGKNKKGEFENKEALPTQSLLESWLRKEHNCLIEIRWFSKRGVKKISKSSDIMWGYTVNYYGQDFKGANEGQSKDDVSGKDFKTHKNALEKALREALKLITKI